MQINDLNLSHYNFYCPVTGTRILSEDGYQPSPAQLGWWLDETANEPEFYNDSIKQLWKAWVDKQQDDEDFCWDVTEFLATLDQPKWVAFRLECGQAITSETTTLLIDMYYEKK